jgi:protein-tyrosine kinase
MENIRQAIERAKAQQRTESPRTRGTQFENPPDKLAPDPAFGHSSDPIPQHGSPRRFRETRLNSTLLKSNRIVAHEITNPLSRPYDMLRTQILQSMDSKGQKVLAVTSPTPACGKTVTAVNLALSISRQTERSVLLVDLDLLRPRVGLCLGLKFDDGVRSVLERRAILSEAIIHARTDSQRLMVLPTTPRAGHSELMASRAMATMFQDLRREFASDIIIVDLPPILSSDDAITILPQVDCVLLVVAVGVSKVSDIQESNRHLQSAEVLRIVVNKVPEASMPYYYGHYY